VTQEKSSRQISQNEDQQTEEQPVTFDMKHDAFQRAPTKEIEIKDILESQLVLQRKQSTMLQKRRPSRDMTDDHQLDAADIEKLRKLGKGNIDSLPAFLRTATTNLRYSQENRFSASQEIEDPRRMA
jgi:hypothetical protein